MSKKTLALIISLVALTAVLLVIALSTREQKVANNTQIPAEQPTPTPPAHTTLTMTPSVLDLSTKGTSGLQTVNVDIDSSDNDVTAVQLEMAYDPKVISNVSIKPATFFDHPTILLDNNNTTTGRISYALGIAPAQEPKMGTGSVVTVTFTLLPGAATDSTQLTLLPRSLVTARGVGQSVLKSAGGVKIMLPARSTTAPTTQTTTVPTH